MQYKVKLSGVSKQYTLYRTNTEKLLDIITPKSLKKNTERNFYALKEITLEIKDGETIGVVGINGSGKSTISNILSGVIPPTTGEVDINGEPSLIAINVGLNNNLSGYDNIELKLLMHGFSRNEINKIVPSIEEFAEIGDFMNQPVKKYSSGMKSRLGFAISVHTNPDLLIVDEALSVGDKTFYQKCLDKINEFKEKGKTIIFISHSIGQIKSISDRVLWLHNGELKEFGETKTVLANYEEYINWFNKLSNNEKQKHKEDLKKKRSSDVSLSHNEKKVEDKFYNPDNLPSRYQPKKRKTKWSKLNIFYLQLAIFLLAFLASSLYLVLPKLSANETIVIDNDKVETDSQESEAKESLFNEPKQGFVAVDSARLYEDATLVDNTELLPFATELILEGEDASQNAYFFNIEDQQYFIDEKEVVLLEDQDELNDLTIDQLVDVLPDTFSNHYEFFLAKIDGNKEDVLSSLRGADEEVIEDRIGSTYTYFPHEKFSIKFNQDGQSVAIINEEATLEKLNISQDNNFLKVGSYNVLINYENDSLAFMK